MANHPSEAAVRAWTRLVRVQQALLAAVERDLKAAGDPPLAWYDVLLELERAEGHRLRANELERRLLLAQYNLSRLLDRMERAGLIRREPCDEDGRGQWAVLTAHGREQRGRMWPSYARAIQSHIGGKLTDGEAEALAALLDRLRTLAAQ